MSLKTDQSFILALSSCGFCQGVPLMVRAATMGSQNNKKRGSLFRLCHVTLSVTVLLFATAPSASVTMQ